MSSNKKKNNNKTNNRKATSVKNEQKNKNLKNEIDESDRIIEQLDRIEKLNENTQIEMESKEDMSLKVKNLIKSDKEAIRLMKEEVSKLEEEDLDYLDDEDEKDVNLDFFENMSREDEAHYNRIRKQQPNRLKAVKGTSVKEFFTGSVRNMAIAITAFVLLIVMFVSLIVLRNESDDTKRYDFIDIETTPFIDTINEYYKSLGSESIEGIRKYIYESDSLSDAEILKLTEEQTFLAEFFFSDILEEPFEITKCYVLEGMKKNEYIVLMKYQFTIKDCTEPATGIFSWYMIDESEGDVPDYKISIAVGNADSKIYKYVCEVENIDKVSELVEDVNEELVEACKKDEVLRKIIFDIYDEMVRNGDNIDDGFRKIIVEIKNYEKTSELETDKIDDSTTVSEN